MGKSPGKWIKTLLTGKKSSKSRTSKGREKFANEREVLVPVKERGTHLGSDQPVTSPSASNNVARNEVNPDLEREALDVSHVEGISLLGNENVGAQEAIPQEALYDPERDKLELAATRIQATFRGFLARRAFWALKGIIRLQALIRGHLVRRQAVATLYCMVGIVKLQAICRGRTIRQSDIGLEVFGRCRLVESQGKLLDHGVTGSAKMAKLSANAFICKLLSSSPAQMPLHLQYESVDPNSVIIWLERWSTSHFWKPAPRPKKLRDPKSRRRLGNSQLNNAEMGRPKRSVRRVPAANIESISVQTISESDKPKRSNRNFPNQPADPVVDNPQAELERVKRNLRKVHNPVLENTMQADSEIEKPSQIREKGTSGPGHDSLEQGKQDPGKAPNISSQEVLEQNASNLSEKISQEMLLTLSKSPDMEATPEPVQDNESINISSVERAADEPDFPTENPKHDDILSTNGNYKGSSPKEDPVKKENQKTNKKAPNAVKQEFAENGTQNSPTLPSYMQATESAKAKLRLQGSPRLSQEGGEKNNTIRRHSLPSATNSKLSSHSPRTQRLVQSGGRGGNRSDKILSSKDGTARAEWKR